MAYWVTSVALTIFGFLTGFSIGLPFFLVGLSMLALGLFRQRPLVFWPALLAVMAFNIGYMAVAPFSCSAGSSDGGPSTTTCASLIGIRYGGEGLYNPALVPALGVGLLAAAATAVSVVIILRRQGG